MRKLARSILCLVLAVSCCAISVAPGLARAQARESFADRVLAVHNAERGRLGLPPLGWSDALAGEAAAWARVLARDGRLHHATQLQRRSHGENLWMGPAGLFSIETILGTIVAERRYFRSGVFPNISTTGRWEDAGHYAQLIWPTTRKVGCAMVASGGDDILVCRYDPGGNFIGEHVG